MGDEIKVGNRVIYEQWNGRRGKVLQVFDRDGEKGARVRWDDTWGEDRVDMSVLTRDRSQEVCGYANFETFSVAVIIQNERLVHDAAVRFMLEHVAMEKSQEQDIERPYRKFVYRAGLRQIDVPGMKGWLDTRLDFEELDQVMRSLID